MKPFRIGGRRAGLPLLALLLAAACRTTPDYNRPLPEGWPALLEVEPADIPPLQCDWPAVKDQLLPALERSIAWTRKDYADQFFPIEGVTRERALASLVRFREILLSAQDATELELAIEREFDVYKSAGWNGRGGGVLYTAYCTPILEGSLEPAPGFEHPLYGLPSDLVKGPHGEILGQQVAEGIAPYPARGVIESSGMLAGRGLELVWLRSALDAFIAHVNGSAFIDLPDGSRLALGYAASNGAEYTSLGRELVKDGELTASEVSLPRIRQWAEEHPQKLESFLHRNDRFVFFTELEGAPRGSLNVEVSGGRSLATDKTLFPRGALVLVDASILDERGRETPYRRLMLDQDTGGAIRTAGRADIYLGIGPDAEQRAGRMRSEGQLYYLFLKPEHVRLRRLGQSL
jgi:membrane-bound lytic murein transglycosylase A